MKDRLTHVRADGSAHMVDVSGKDVTARAASARGRVLLSEEAGSAARRERPQGRRAPRWRAWPAQAVKRTPDLILAHPTAVHGVEVDLTVVDEGVEIEATVHSRPHRHRDGGPHRRQRRGPHRHRHGEGGRPACPDHGCP